MVGIRWWQRLKVVLLVGAMFGTALSTMAQADQHAAELPKLFEDLKAAESQTAAREVERAIWAHWLTGPDKTSNDLMSQIERSMQYGELRLGLRLCNQLVDSYPDYAEAWNKRATFYYLMDRMEASVADIQTTLDLEPRHFGALSGFGLIMMREGNHEAALSAFEEVLMISPQSASAEMNAALAKDKIGTDI